MLALKSVISSNKFFSNINEQSDLFMYRLSGLQNNHRIFRGYFRCTFSNIRCPKWMDWKKWNYFQQTDHLYVYSKMVKFSIPLMIHFKFVVANDKHPVYDQNGSFNMQSQKMLLPSINQTTSRKSSNVSMNRVPLGEIERNSIYQQYNRNSHTDVPLKFMRTNNHDMVPNNTPVAQKEKLYGVFLH